MYRLQPSHPHAADNTPIFSIIVLDIFEILSNKFVKNLSKNPLFRFKYRLNFAFSLKICY